jgi:hypothetical protein
VQVGGQLSEVGEPGGPAQPVGPVGQLFQPLGVDLVYQAAFLSAQLVGSAMAVLFILL